MWVRTCRSCATPPLAGRAGAVASLAIGDHPRPVPTAACTSAVWQPVCSTSADRGLPRTSHRRKTVPEPPPARSVNRARRAAPSVRPTPESAARGVPGGSAELHLLAAPGAGALANGARRRSVCRRCPLPMLVKASANGPAPAVRRRCPQGPGQRLRRTPGSSLRRGAEPSRLHSSMRHWALMMGRARAAICAGLGPAGCWPLVPLALWRLTPAAMAI